MEHEDPSVSRPDAKLASALGRAVRDLRQRGSMREPMYATGSKKTPRPPVRTQEELAGTWAAVGRTERNQKAVSDLEQGKRVDISVDELLSLAWALDASPQTLLLRAIDLEPDWFQDRGVSRADAHAWVLGKRRLPGQDGARFLANQPAPPTSLDTDRTTPWHSFATALDYGLMGFMNAWEGPDGTPEVDRLAEFGEFIKDSIDMIVAASVRPPKNPE